MNSDGVNGLGAWWFPAPLRRYLTRKSAEFFRKAAWEKHDIGYGLGSPSRLVCDIRFLSAMVHDATYSDRPRRTLFLALLFFFCVRVGGRLSYNRKPKS